MSYYYSNNFCNSGAILIISLIISVIVYKLIEIIGNEILNKGLKPSFLKIFGRWCYFSLIWNAFLGNLFGSIIENVFLSSKAL